MSKIMHARKVQSRRVRNLHIFSHIVYVTAANLMKTVKNPGNSGDRDATQSVQTAE